MDIKNAAENLKKKVPVSRAGKEPKKCDLVSECRGKLCFAFDFGEYAVKIAVAKIGRKSVEVRNLVVVENDERTARIEESNLKEWRTKILRALNQNGLSPYGQIGLCTVSSRNYISRRLDIPQASDTDRQGLVSYEMSQSLSLDAESYLFQHRIERTYEKEDVKMCTVWAAAVSRTLCENYCRLLESLRLKPLVMDINVNGMERIFASDVALRIKTKNRAVMVLDYGIRGTELSIFEDGRYVQGVDLDSGEGKLVTAAKNVLGVQITDIHNGNKLVVSPQKIYEIMKQARTSETAAVFSDVVERWLTEINTVVRRYNIDHPSAPLAGLLLTGGSFQFPWLKAYLEKYISLSAEVISSLDCLTFSPRITMAENTVPQFINALSLFVSGEKQEG